MKKKGYYKEANTWFWLGLLLGIFALIIVLLKPKRESHRKVRFGFSQQQNAVRMTEADVGNFVRHRRKRGIFLFCDLSYFYPHDFHLALLYTVGVKRLDKNAFFLHKVQNCFFAIPHLAFCITHPGADARQARQTYRSVQSAHHRCRPLRSYPFPDR